MIHAEISKQHETGRHRTLTLDTKRISYSKMIPKFSMFKRPQYIQCLIRLKSTSNLITMILFLFGIVGMQIFILKPTRYKLTWNYVKYDDENCGCPRWGPPILEHQNKSFCSDYATSRGPNQKVVSYTIYGDANKERVAKRFYNQIEDRILEIQKLYEGWVVRLYHNSKEDDVTSHDVICRLYCKYEHFDPCKVGELIIPSWLRNSLHNKSTSPARRKQKKMSPFPELDFLFKINDQLSFWLNNASPYKTDFEQTEDSNGASIDKFTSILIGKTWRFLVMGDPLVSVFIVRDVDSYILKREVDAVFEWLNNSTALIHAMRDHPSHNGQILAGMWGGVSHRNRSKMSYIFRKILEEKHKNLWDFDQTLLRTVIWPEVLNDIIVHDSYHCRNPFILSNHLPVPFPTRREGKLFVSWGPARSKSEIENLVECPFVCRPKGHPDWKLC